MTTTRTLSLTAITMVAFAANSVLCRQALGSEHIDPVGFTAVRLLSGAMMLALLISLKGNGQHRQIPRNGSWRSATALFVYAITFSFAYITLDAGTGALILFAAVQATMIGVGLWRGDRPGVIEWAGMATAMGGLIYLLSPGLSAPPVFGAALMAVSGVAWGAYSLYGRGETNPTAATAGNFIRAAPFMLLIAVVLWPNLQGDTEGLLLAVASGALASGVGYAIWYAALPGLMASTAATVQLTVPAIAAVGGVLFLGETATFRLMVAGALILGGVAIAIQGRNRVA
jgi:drug/metabolite transporter (DMT)-like permease